MMAGEDEHLEAAYEGRNTAPEDAGDIEDMEYSLMYDEDEELSEPCDECHAPAGQPCDSGCVNHPDNIEKGG
jgi:hypothetical protein